MTIRVRISFVLLASALMLSATGCKSFSRTISRGYGFREIVPPTKLYMPGTVVKVVSNSPLRLSIVCEAVESVGNATPQMSPAKSTDLQNKLQGEWKVTADYVKQVQAGASGKFLKNLMMTFADVKVHEFSEATLDGLIRKNRTPDCRNRVAWNLNNGKPITMVKESLQADAKVTAEWNTNVSVDAGAKAEVLNGVAAAFSGSVSNEGKEVTTGEDLIWGILDDPDTINAIPEGTTRSRRDQKRPIIVGAGMAEVVPDPDAAMYRVP